MTYPFVTISETRFPTSGIATSPRLSGPTSGTDPLLSRHGKTIRRTSEGLRVPSYPIALSVSSRCWRVRRNPKTFVSIEIGQMLVPTSSIARRSASWKDDGP